MLAGEHRLDRRRRRDGPAHADPGDAAPALGGSLSKAEFRRDPHFGFAVPGSVPGVEPHVLSPIRTWANKASFADTATRLVDMFRENFKRFEGHVDADMRGGRAGRLDRRVEADPSRRQRPVASIGRCGPGRKGHARAIRVFLPQRGLDPWDA